MTGNKEPQAIGPHFAAKTARAVWNHLMCDSKISQQLLTTEVGEAYCVVGYRKESVEPEFENILLGSTNVAFRAPKMLAAATAHAVYLRSHPLDTTSKGCVSDAENAAGVVGRSKVVAFGGSRWTAELSEMFAAYMVVELIGTDPLRAEARKIAHRVLVAKGNQYADLILTPL